MIRVGVDYYPEHWDPSWWEEDAREMVKAGINTVRIAEFTWGVLEPTEGNFNFSWLDKAIEIFDKYNLDVMLGTPTNCAPVWLYTKYPQTRQADRDGNRTALGIRGHRCMTDSTFRRFAEIIVSKMAERYANNPRVIAWQIDNEPEGNHCCCPSCAARFREHLKEKYGTIEKVNKAWGNDVWSGQYSDFEEIMPPLGAVNQFNWMNPAYLLDYEKWTTLSAGEYLRFQRDIIKSFKHDAVVTTNACFNPHMPDFHAIFEDYEAASYDNYPEVRIPQDSQAIYSQAFALDLIRGYKRKNFWILEQLSGPKGCWCPISPTLPPRMLKGYAWQTIAHGADLILFFRWRTSQSGAEMFCHGLSETRKQSGRRYEEFVDFVRELNGYHEMYGALVKSRVAILYSYVQDKALRIQPQSEGFAYWEQLKLWHDGFLSLGVNVDVIGADSQLDGYDVVVAPTQFVTDSELVKRLEAFTQAGGRVVLTNRTGVITPENNRNTDDLPGEFRKLAGCYVSEYDPIGSISQNIKTVSGDSYPITRWCDILALETAEVYAEYADSFYKGSAAVTVNSFGSGKCYYVGTVGDRAFYKAMAKELLRDTDIAVCEDIPTGVEVVSREKDTNKWTFIFNNTEAQQSFSFNGDEISLKPFEVKINAEKKV